MTSQILNRTPLPIDPFLSSIAKDLESHRSVIILAEPGAGKSTRIPMALLGFSNEERKFSGGVWIMIQPRRWAAKLVAQRIAKENGFNIGEEIGYQVRFENRISRQSRLWVMTEGVLMRRLLSDPELSGIQGVILDEFHERSVDLDMSLALLKELQESLRPDLKMVVMSATIDPTPLQKFLPESKIFEIPGRVFPVKRKFLGEVSVSRAVEQALRDFPIEGDGLVFLPGAYEIDRAIEEVRGVLSSQVGVELLPLYSSLPDREQQKVFDESSRRKIIFSTNIAETSITLPKIKFVIDSGLAKVMRNDPQLGQDRLELLRISRASSEQRAGRAGRVSEGVCYRLWSEEENTQLRSNETPEIHRVNLSSAFLFLAAYGVPDPEKLEWFEKPRSSAINFAKQELEHLGLVECGSITEDGKRAAELPLPPPLAKLRLVGERNAALDFASRLAAFLEDQKSTADITDWDHLIRALNQLGGRALQSAKQIGGQGDQGNLARVKIEDAPLYESILVQSLRSRVFINEKKVGRRTIRANHRAVVLPKAGFILNSIERDEKGVPTILVRSFIPLHSDSLNKYSSKKRIVEWNATDERVRAREGIYFEDLALSAETDVPVTAAEAEQALQNLISVDPEKFFIKDPEFKLWKKRFDLWQSIAGDSLAFPWDELIQAAVQGKTKLQEVFLFPWKAYLESSQPGFKKIDQQLPEKIKVPSGSMIKIDYESNPPKLSVRLQEVFGWTETPRLMDGKVQLLIELLSPNFRPIQLTRDLKSFWGNAYFEVKKELKARYPKHAWPEDPLNAKPEAKGRRRQ